MEIRRHAFNESLRNGNKESIFLLFNFRPINITLFREVYLHCSLALQIDPETKYINNISRDMIV